MSERASSKPAPTQTAPVEQPMMGGAEQISQVAMMPAHEYKALMQAKVYADAEKIKTQETRPGGAFLVEGQWVDANGRPLRDQDVKDFQAPKDVEVKTASEEDQKNWDANQPTATNESPEAAEERQKAERSAS